MPHPAEGARRDSPPAGPAAVDRCRICGSDNVAFLTALEAAPGELHKFFRCAACRSILDLENVPPDYSLGDPERCDPALSAKISIEAEAGLFFMAAGMQLLRQALTGRAGRVRYVEVGSGIGFTLHMAELLGWEAEGIEPSPAGELGRKLLGTTVRHARIEDVARPRDVDLFVASEVIEHLPDVHQFLEVAVQSLAPDGVLLLTTPNADVLADGGRSEVQWRQTFGAGEHLNIFSPDAIRLALDRHGLRDVRVFLSEGSSGRQRLIVVAARTPSRLPESLDWEQAREEGKRFLEWYLRRVLAQLGPERKTAADSLYVGVLYRLIELLVNDGRGDDAEPHVEAFDRLLADAGFTEQRAMALEAPEFLPWLSRIPACVGSYHFYKGTLALLRQRYEDARRLFGIAARLFHYQETASRDLYPRGWALRARLHEGIALLHLGLHARALEIFASLLASGEPMTEHDRNSLLWNKAVAHLQTGENVSSLAIFAEFALRDVSALSPATQRTLVHMLLAASQMWSKLEGQVAETAAGAGALAREAEKGLRLYETALERDRRERAAAAVRMQAVERTLTELAADRVYQADQRAALAQLTASVAQGLDALNRLAGAVEWVVGEGRLPERMARKAFRFVRRSFGAGPPAEPAPKPEPPEPPPAPAPARSGPQQLADVPGAFVTPEGGDAVPGELVRGRCVDQQVVCRDDGFAKVWIKLGTYGRENRSHLEVVIRDERGEPLRQVMEPMAGCANNALHLFVFDPIEGSAGKRYTVSVSSPDAAPGDAATVWCRTEAGEGLLAIDGQETRGTLIYDLGYVHPRSRQRDVLIITPDVIGDVRIGLGMRHWEIATALAARGVTVTLAATHPLPARLKGAGFELASLSEADAPVRLAVRHRAVLVQGDILHRYPELERHAGRVIADMVTPIHVENLNGSSEEFEHASRIIRQCLTRGDFFVCGNERQRLYWLGMLTELGRLAEKRSPDDREFRRLIDVVGFGIPDEPPVKTRSVLRGRMPGIGPGDFVMIWFGGMWDWLDPLTLVRAVHEAHQAEPRVKLLFSFYRRPGGEPARMARAARDLAAELGALDRSVLFNEYPIPYAERGDFLLECDAGVLCQAANFETQVSARTRVLDYLWAGLPSLMNDGDELAEFVHRHDLGVVVPGRDVGTFAEAVLRMARDPEGRRRQAANVARMRTEFYWRNLVDPIVRYLAASNAD